MAKHFDKQFKLDAVQYYHDHRDLVVLCQDLVLTNQQKELLIESSHLSETQLHALINFFKTL